MSLVVPSAGTQLVLISVITGDGPGRGYQVQLCTHMPPPPTPPKAPHRMRALCMAFATLPKPPLHSRGPFATLQMCPDAIREIVHFLVIFNIMCSQTPHARGVCTLRRSQRARSRLRTTSKCIAALPRCVDVIHEGLTHGGRLEQSLHRGAIATYKKQANN